jgi:HAD superfamily hydrolase (TIGR01549 family)
MGIDVKRIEAVTLDFYNTLVYHKRGTGRGVELMEYLNSQGLHSDPWEHQVLYDLFDRHATDYSPKFSTEEKRRYLRRLTARLFNRLNVKISAAATEEHVTAVWQLLGPNSLRVYPEVLRALEALRNSGYPLAIISNWQCGLAHYCHELGFAGFFEHVIASAEVGIAKPDPMIFRDVCKRMRVPCDRVLHVGDSLVDDVEGARGVGMQVLMIQRNREPLDANIQTIRSLDEVVELLRGFDASPT